MGKINCQRYIYLTNIKFFKDHKEVIERVKESMEIVFQLFTSQSGNFPPIYYIYLRYLISRSIEIKHQKMG